MNVINSYSVFYLLPASHKLMKGNHHIHKVNLRVEMAYRTPTEHQMKSAAYIAGKNRTPFPSSSTKVMAETSQSKTPKVSSSSGYQQSDNTHHQTGGVSGSVHSMQGGHDEGYAYHHSNYQPQGGLKKDCKIPAVGDRNRTTHPGTEGQQGNSAQPKYNTWSGTLSDTSEKSKPFTRQVSSSVDATSPIQLRRGGLTDHQVCVCECYVCTYVSQRHISPVDLPRHFKHSSVHLHTYTVHT